MPRKETEYNIGISKGDAKALSETGKGSQVNRGIQPKSESLDQFKLPSKREEDMLNSAGYASQRKKTESREAASKRREGGSWSLMISLVKLPGMYYPCINLILYQFTKFFGHQTKTLVMQRLVYFALKPEVSLSRWTWSYTDVFLCSTVFAFGIFGRSSLFIYAMRISTL